MRIAGQGEPTRAPGRGWVLAVYVVAPLELVGGLYWAVSIWSAPQDLGFGLTLDARPLSIAVAVATVAGAVVMFAFASLIEMVGRSLLASEDAVARAGAIEAAIDDMIDGQPAPRPQLMRVER